MRIILFISVILLSFLCYNISSENKRMKNDLKKCSLAMFTMDSILNIQNEIIKENFNHVKRMQIIAGVDTIDNIFTYKEKVLNGVNTKRLLHFKRKYTP